MKIDNIPTRFDHSKESEIYRQWEQDEAFKTKKSDKKFSIILPPPNVTGDLHMGHALVYTLHDIIARSRRRNGFETLLVPGADHASIAVEMLVTKKLEKDGIRKNEIGREKFLEETWKWIEHYKPRIIDSLKRIGLSANWEKFMFTMDERSQQAVNTAFVELYKKDLIYRGRYIVNWDPKLQTVISDDELEWKEEKTKLYYLKYGPFIIATARPETKFGDKYVVMHPDDGRYSRYKHGEKIEITWINGAATATVIKDEAIDMEFGTGVMTITPWHDATDFEIATRHTLEMEQIIDQYGKLLPIAGEFSGERATAAREKIVEKLNKLGLVEKVDENYTHRIAVNSRGGGVIEPQVQTQWFMRTTAIKKEAIRVVKEREVKFYPSSIEKTYFNWLNNLHDWCISRTLWWGHKIPVYYCTGSEKKSKEQSASSRSENNENFYVGTQRPEKCPICGSCTMQESEEVLDTWFSSALWPITTLGGFESDSVNRADFERYYPTSLLITGSDILFFWVARMIFMSLIFHDTVPFKEVYFHGLVLDASGQKMSKTKGNVIEPLEVIDKYGADALRMSVVGSVGIGQNQKFSEQKLLKYRNFTTKIWNASRFVALFAPKTNKDISKLELDRTEKTFLEKLEKLEQNNRDYFTDYRISLALDELYEFFWFEFADKLVEYEKTAINEGTPQRSEHAQIFLRNALDRQLTLIADFAPYLCHCVRKEMFNNKL